MVRASRRLLDWKIPHSPWVQADQLAFVVSGGKVKGSTDLVVEPRDRERRIGRGDGLASAAARTWEIVRGPLTARSLVELKVGYS